MGFSLYIGSIRPLKVKFLSNGNTASPYAFYLVSKPELSWDVGLIFNLFAVNGTALDPMFLF